MKLLSLCPLCDSDEIRVVPIHLRDDGVADAICPSSHKFVVVSPHDKFEILFDAAALALLDEYPREAISDFAAALEEFYGFVIRAMSEYRIIAQEAEEISSDESSKTWKQVAAQSERQVGAFLYIYLLVTGKTYQLDTEGIKLRNKVIHRGYLPTLKEATAFGERVWHDITSVQQDLLEAGMFTSPSEGEHRPYKIAGDMPLVNLIELPHAIMLNQSLELGGFSERLFRLRTVWRGAIYGRGPWGNI